MFSSKIWAQENNQKTFFNPKRTMLASAILPGTGQIINNQWWKTPVIFTALAGCYYYFNFSRLKYLDFRDAYILRTDENPLTIDKYDPDYGNAEYRYANASQLKYFRDAYRRDMEFSVILTTGVYVLNIIDAYVGAHLKSFNLNDDLSLSVYPSLTHRTQGFLLTACFTLK